MTAFTVRMPEDKHRRLKNLAQARGVSVNKLMEEAATAMLAEFDAQTRFQIRAAQGDTQRGLRLLDQALTP